MTHPSPVPDEGPEQGFDVAGFLMRRKWLIVFGLIVGLGLGYVYFVKQPAVYQSTGRVLVIKPMAQMPISGGMTMDPMLRQRDYLANDVFMIRSKDIVGPAVTDNKLNELPTFSRVASPTDAILRGLTVSRVDSNADLLEVGFSGQIPDDCGTIVNAVLRSYRMHVQQQFVNSSNMLVNLLTEAKVDLRKQLDEATEDYKTFRRQEGGLLFNGTTATNKFSQHIDSTNSRLAELQIKQREIEGKLNAVDDALQRGGSREALRLMIDQTASADGDSAAPGTPMSIARDLFQLEVELQILLEQYGPEHPKVTSHKRRIDLTRQFLQDQGVQQGGTKREPVDFLQVYIDSLKLELDTNQKEQSELQALYDEQTKEARKWSDLELEHGDKLAEKERLQKLFDTVITRLEDIDFVADNGGYSAEIIAPAGRGYQVAPNLPKIMTVAGILGALCGLLLGYVVEAADQSFKSPEEISQLLGLQIIGHCPLITTAGRPKDANGNSAVDPSIVTFYRSNSPGAEAFRAIRTALYFSTRGANHKVIQITSPHPGDGKSTLTCNLAVTIAQSGKKVILMDADFRRPRVHKIFGIGNDAGISSAINGEIELMDAVQQTTVANLDCITCGPRPENPSELLTQARFEELLGMLREKYDFVLIDTPPLLAVTDPSAVAPRVDGVLLCIRVNNKSRMDAVRATGMLAQLDAHILGIVVNGIDGSSRGKYGYGNRGYYRAGYLHGYGYGYGYGMHDEAANPSHAKYFDDDRKPVSPNGQRQRARS